MKCITAKINVRIIIRLQSAKTIQNKAKTKPEIIIGQTIGIIVKDDIHSIRPESIVVNAQFEKFVKKVACWRHIQVDNHPHSLVEIYAAGVLNIS